MAAVNATFNAVICDLYGRTITGPVKIVGQIMYTDVGVGGGPMPPGEGGGAPGDPVHIWGGGNVPMPSPPIANVPGAPGYRPPMPDAPPPEGTKPPPSGESGWGYYEGRWGYFPGPGEASPKA